jgi:hypothetical protein
VGFLILENLHAATRVCDTHPSTIVAYTAGQPSQLALGIMAALTGGMPKVIVVSNADLGGGRIAARVPDALPLLIGLSWWTSELIQRVDVLDGLIHEYRHTACRTGCMPAKTVNSGGPDRSVRG